MRHYRMTHDVGTGSAGRAGAQAAQCWASGGTAVHSVELLHVSFSLLCESQPHRASQPWCGLARATLVGLPKCQFDT